MTTLELRVLRQRETATRQDFKEKKTGLDTEPDPYFLRSPTSYLRQSYHPYQDGEGRQHRLQPVYAPSL